MKVFHVPVVMCCVVVLVIGCSEKTGNVANPPEPSAKVSDQLDTLRAASDEQTSLLRQLSRGTWVLLSLIEEPERYQRLTEFLRTINKDQLRCEIRELEYYPVVLYIFRSSYSLPDGSAREVFDRKSALVLVDAQSG